MRLSPDNPDDAEICDDGPDNQDGAYGGCQTDCTLGPYCGDGVVHPEHEECEPTDESDGPDCMHDCYFVGRAVFVSSAVFTGDFASFVINGTGLDGADEACHQLATQAGLPLPESYRAWLGSADGGPNDRITPQLVDLTAPVRLVDGTIVAKDWPSFVSPTHEHAIDLSEVGSSVPNDYVWTSLTPTGETVEPNCENWGAEDHDGFGAVGISGAHDSSWTQLGYESCSYMYHVYCIQTAMPGDGV